MQNHKRKKSPPRIQLYWIQLLSILLSIFIVFLFLRLFLSSTATAFTEDYEKQSFLELGRGETYIIGRKLAPLAKSGRFSCVMAHKNNVTFFEDKIGNCNPSIFRTVRIIQQNSHGIKIIFTFQLPNGLSYGFIVFATLQIALVVLVLFTQKQTFLREHALELKLADQAIQVAHDIASPIALLKTLQKDNSHLEKETLLSSALNRLEALVAHLHNKTTESKELCDSRWETISLILQRAVEQKTAEFSHKIKIRLDIDESLYDFIMPGDSLEWARALSNLLNNAIEASQSNPQASSTAHTVVTIIAQTNPNNPNFVQIHIIDHGKGISTEMLKHIGQKGFSYGKINGSGLGVYSVKNFLDRIHGKISFQPAVPTGTEVLIELPKKENTIIVLIEHDEALASLWRKAAIRKGIPFQHFTHPDLFMKQIESTPYNTLIYMDVCFPDEHEKKIDILQFSKSLFEKGFKQLHLTTGYNQKKFNHIPWIISVTGKEPPYL